MPIQVTWWGHATFALQIDGYNVWIDPWLTDNPMTNLTPDKVEADYILVTHGHGDHLGDTIPLAQRTGATVITVAELAHWLDTQGVKTQMQHIGGTVNYPFGKVKLTIAHHGSRLPDGSYAGPPCGVLVRSTGGQTVYHAGDTGLFLDMQLYGDEGIDLAILPIGDAVTMGPDDALRALRLLKPRFAMPMHYNTWEGIKQDEKAWGARVAAETSAQAVLLQPGESFELD
ncbi:MAG: metal-dependent hydrolase [Anaerolineae bacterium]|nr:metal-dependent hydrolase [Anaerolineae bacterium]